MWQEVSLLLFYLHVEMIFFLNQEIVDFSQYQLITLIHKKKEMKENK